MDPSMLGDIDVLLLDIGTFYASLRERAFGAEKLLFICLTANAR